jgi:hypothetical protein
MPAKDALRRNLWSALRPDLWVGGLEVADLVAMAIGICWSPMAMRSTTRLPAPAMASVVRESGELRFAYHRLRSASAIEPWQPISTATGSGHCRGHWLPRVRPLAWQVTELATIVPDKPRRATSPATPWRRGQPIYATVATGDFDADGDAVCRRIGAQCGGGPFKKHYLTVWWNQTIVNQP